MPSFNLQGSVPADAHDPVGGSSGRSLGRHAAPGNWAPASRPVRRVGGGYTRAEGHEGSAGGARDGDRRSALTGACRGRWRSGRMASPTGGVQVHCLRMIGFLRRRPRTRPGDDDGRPWQGIGGFTEERASQCAPGCTRSPQPVPHTRARGEPAPRQGSGTCLSTKRPCRPRATRRLAAARLRSPHRGCR